MKKRDVLASVEAARAELLAAIEGLSEEQMTKVPVAGDWTLKEILAHIAGWTVWDLAAVRGILAGDTPDFAPIADVDAFNAALVAERCSWPLERILLEMEEALEATLELLAGLPENEIFDEGRFRGPYWRSLAEWLQVAWEHEQEHTEQIRAWREEVAHAH
jgi:hypothetical protein